MGGVVGLAHEHRATLSVPRRLAILAAVCALLGAAVSAQRLSARAPGEGSAAATVAVPPTVPQATPRARQYQIAAYTMYFVGTGWTWLGLWCFVRRGWSLRWRDWSERSTPRGFGRVCLFYAAYSLAALVWALPISAAGALMEAWFGFSTRTFGGWLADLGRGYAIGLTSAAAVGFGYWLLACSPKRWWLWLWAGSVPWMLATLVLEPVLIAPLYNDFRPLAPGPLRDRLASLASRAGIGDATVLVADTSRRTRKLNAYVTGLGPTRRIVLWDNLVRSSPPDQVEAVVAHEIGHYVLGHRWRQFAWGILGAGTILWLLSVLLPLVFARLGPHAGLSGLSDLAGLPLVSLVLSVMLFLESPIDAAISRAHERAADRYGIGLTHNGEAAARQFVQFVRRDYADPDPPTFLVFWFYSHPPIRERVASALAQR